jgi:hypothetical protein
MAHISLNLALWAAEDSSMRLLQLSLEADDSAVIDLHPFLSVVQGLDERNRDGLIRTVAAVAAGTEPPCAGMAEAHGVVLPLDEANLTLLDISSTTDPIVWRTDLPGAVPDPGADAGSDTAETDPSVALLESAPEGEHPELDEARRHHHNTREALRVLTGVAEGNARSLAEAIDDRRRIADAIASIDDDGEPGPVSELVALEKDLAAVDAGIAELSGLNIEPVRVLIDAIETPGPVDEVPSPMGLELANEILRLLGEVAELEQRMEVEGRGPGSALARLDAAREEAGVAEASLTRPPVSTVDEAALRAAHEEVLDAEQRASGLRSRSGQRKLVQALAVQQEILDRVGFPTWSAYVMGATIMGVDQAAKDRLEAAEQELAAAEQAWVDISAQLEADPDHRALLDQLEDVELRAIGLLLERGERVPDEREDLEGSLRALRQPATESDFVELVATLAYQLTSLGLHVDPSEADRVLTAGHALLDEFAFVPQRLDELTNDRRRLETSVVEARSRAEAAAWEALEAAVERPSSERIAELELALTAATAKEHELAERLEAREALVEMATLAEAASARRARATATAIVESQGAVVADDGTVDLWTEMDPEAIEFYLLARLAALRHVSYAGSVPLVLVDTFRGLDDEAVRRVLGALARMSESVQILVLSDDGPVASWAAEQGPDAAAVVSAAPAFA